MKTLLLLIMLVGVCNAQYYGYWIAEEPKGIELGEYFKECPICQEPHYESVEVSSSMVVNVDTTTVTDFYGMRVHKECVNQFMEQLVIKFREEFMKIDYGALYVTSACVLTFSDLTISTVTCRKGFKEKKRSWFKRLFGIKGD